jgi:hypothetical protein
MPETAWKTETTQTVNVTDQYRDLAKGYVGGEPDAVFVTSMFDELSQSIIDRHKLTRKRNEDGSGHYEGLADMANMAISGAVVSCLRPDCDLRINLIDVAKGEVDCLQLSCTPRVFDTEEEAKACEEGCATARAETLSNIPNFLQSVNEAVAENKRKIDEANQAIAEAEIVLDRYI